MIEAVDTIYEIYDWFDMWWGKLCNTFVFSHVRKQVRNWRSQDQHPLDPQIEQRPSNDQSHHPQQGLCQAPAWDIAFEGTATQRHCWAVKPQVFPVFPCIPFFAKGRSWCTRRVCVISLRHLSGDLKCCREVEHCMYHEWKFWHGTAMHCLCQRWWNHQSFHLDPFDGWPAWELVCPVDRFLQGCETEFDRLCLGFTYLEQWTFAQYSQKKGKQCAEMPPSWWWFGMAPPFGYVERISVTLGEADLMSARPL